MLKKVGHLLLKGIQVIAIVLGAALALFYAGVYLPDDFEANLKRDVGTKVVFLQARIPGTNNAATGTGFHVRTKSGKTVILTNKHVCGNFEQMKALGGGSRGKEVKVLARADDEDLCILEGLDGVEPLTQAHHMNSVETLYILGFPGALPYVMRKGHFVTERTLSNDIGFVDNEAVMAGVPGAMTEDQCSGSNRSVEEHEEQIQAPFGVLSVVIRVCMEKLDVATLDIPVFFGNSGSPVFNKSGEYVGVAFAMSKESGFSEMISAKKIKKFLETQ